MSFTPMTLQTIPVIEEKPSISKESVAHSMVIEKRWVAKTELVIVPVTYEEVYVNGKPIAAEVEFYPISRKHCLEKMKLQKKSNDIKSTWEFVPVSTIKVEKVIPVYGKRIIITKKKIAKLDDLISGKAE